MKNVHAHAGRDATLERKASYIRKNSEGGVTIEGNFFLLCRRVDRVFSDN